MSSSLGTEKSPVASRSKTVLLIFASYGLGSFAANIVFLVLVTAFKGSIESDVKHIQWVWRLLLGIGIIPPAVTLYGRLTMKETTPYQKCEWRKSWETCARPLSNSTVLLRCRS
jgi:PHS family inorganic phosphate transporter-like MFS transporter